MSKRSLLFYPILLIVGGMISALAAAENSDDYRSVTAEVTDDDMVIEPGNAPEALPEKIDKSATTKQKRRSIKMIVGGQSVDGLAKQVTLPIGD